MTLIALLVLLQTPPPTSAPPLVPLDAPLLPAPPMQRFDPAVAPPLPQVDNALNFSPGSLFALFVCVEYERRLSTQLTGFVAIGGGPFGQLGFDVGARLYPVDRAFESFFADARFSGFAMTSGMVLLGPMVELGYAWRVRKSFLVSVAAGAAMWLSAARAGPSGIFRGSVIDAAVFSLPGFFQPPRGQVGLQPTFRLTLGPAF